MPSEPFRPSGPPEEGGRLSHASAEGVEPADHEPANLPPLREDPAAPVEPVPEGTPYYPPGPLGVTVAHPVKLDGPVVSRDLPPNGWAPSVFGVNEQMRQVAPANPERSKLTLTETTGNVVLLAPEVGGNVYPLSPFGTLVMTHTGPVYASTIPGSGAVSDLYIISEFHRR